MSVAYVEDPAEIPGTQSSEPVSLTVPTESTTMTFGPLRRAQTVTIPLGSDDEVPDDIGDAAVVVDGPIREGEQSGLAVYYDVRVIDEAVKVDLCVDPSPRRQQPEAGTAAENLESTPRIGFSEWLRGTFTTRAGTYTAQVDLRHQGIEADPATFEIQAQGRYLWLLVPGLVLFPLLATWIVYPTPPQGWKGWIVPWLLGFAAAAAAFGTQAFNNPTWGGMGAVLSLVAVMYSTSIAAITAAAKAPSAREALMERYGVQQQEAQEGETDDTVEVVEVVEVVAEPPVGPGAVGTPPSEEQPPQ